jgi:5-methylcytosine-specific restriction endonuclease McrA
MQYCVQPGCSVLVRRGRCRQHNQPKLWYARARWFRLRAEVLVAAAYQCALCGHVAAALEVDHIVKHDGDPARFWDRANLQALCPTCHSEKTNRGA